MRIYFTGLEVVCNPIHRGPLKPIKNVDPKDEKDNFIGPTRVQTMQNSIEEIARVLHSQSEFLFSGGLAIALTLQALQSQGLNARDFLPKGLEINVINGFYRDHQAIRIACMEEDLANIVESANKQYSPFSRKIMAKIAKEKKGDVYKPLKVEEAPEAKNIRLISTSKNKIKPHIALTDYADIFLHHYETSDGHRVIKCLNTDEITPKLQPTKSYKDATTQQIIKKNDIWIVSNEDNKRVPYNMYRGYTTKLAQTGVVTAVHPVYLYLIIASRHRKKGKIYDRDDVDLEILRNILTHIGEWETAENLVRADFSRRITSTH